MSTSNKIIGRCALPGDCVWPDCTCPDVARAVTTQEGVPDTNNALHRTPTGPKLKRRARPEGWTAMSPWCVVRVKGSCENLVSRECANQDMETWYPRYVKPGSAVPAPLFPGYMFVKPGDNFRALRNTRGVIDIVMMGGKPDYISKQAFKALRKMANKEGIVTLPSQRPPEKGERVQIKVGAWQGFVGLYDGLDLDGRLQVLFSMFGKQVTLKFKRPSSIEVMD